MRLPARPDAVGRGLAFARSFAERRRLPADVADRLAIIVEEWVMNVVEHGHAAPAGQIVLHLHQAGAMLRLSVSDPGIAFDPRGAGFDGPNPERGGGAGLALIATWSRIASYSRSRGRNRLVLEMPAA
ncbi:MAG TPA: ATP-binding protein [Phenylobacterium sp.]|nr:ATP-binding protein [Phenylobacterium sp.]